MPDIDLRIHPGQRDRGAGARAAAQVSCPPVAELWLGLGIPGEHGETGRTSPLTLDHVVECLSLIGVWSPRIVHAADTAGVGAIHHQRAGAVGPGGREQCRHCASFGAAEQDRLLRSGGSHHRLHILDPLFERWRPNGPVGQARAAFVEQDQPRERCEAAQETGIPRLVPVFFDIGDPAGNVNQVDRSGSHHLVGNAEFANLRVLGNWFLNSHCWPLAASRHRSVSPPPPNGRFPSSIRFPCCPACGIRVDAHRVGNVVSARMLRIVFPIARKESVSPPNLRPGTAFCPGRNLTRRWISAAARSQPAAPRRRGKRYWKGSWVALPGLRNQNTRPTIRTYVR